MTERQIELLRMSVNGVDYYRDIPESDRAALHYLAKDGLVRTASLSDTVCYITERGKAYLAALDNDEHTRNAEKATKIHSRRKEHIFQACLVLLGAVLAGIVTVLIYWLFGIG